MCFRLTSKVLDVSFETRNQHIARFWDGKLGFKIDYAHRVK